MDQTQPQQKAEPRLDVNRKKTAEYARNVWVATVEPGLTREQILDPAFWSHHGHDLKQYDRVEVNCDDGSIYAELLVVQADRNYAKMHVLRWEKLMDKDALEASKPAGVIDDYLLQYKGQIKQWCVIRKTDGAIIREAEKSKQDAQLWLDEWIRVTGATPMKAAA